MAYETLLKRAVSDLEVGRTKEAREALKAITKLDPNNEMAWLWYAHSIPSDEDSIAVLRNYLAINPDSVEAQRHLESYLKKLNHKKEAVEISEKSKTSRSASGAEKTQPKTNEARSISGLLEIARRDLLDLGLRNPLINYRLLKARGLEIDEADPQMILDALVFNGRKLYFRPLPEEDTEVDRTEPESDDEMNSSIKNDGYHRNLQTIHTATELDKRLLNTYYVSRTYIEEQGVNVFF